MRGHNTQAWHNFFPCSPQLLLFFKNPLWWRVLKNLKVYKLYCDKQVTHKGLQEHLISPSHSLSSFSSLNAPIADPLFLLPCLLPTCKPTYLFFVPIFYFSSSSSLSLRNLCLIPHAAWRQLLSQAQLHSGKPIRTGRDISLSPVSPSPTLFPLFFSLVTPISSHYHASFSPSHPPFIHSPPSSAVIIYLIYTLPISIIGTPYNISLSFLFSHHSCEEGIRMRITAPRSPSELQWQKGDSNLSLPEPTLKH